MRTSWSAALRRSGRWIVTVSTSMRPPEIPKALRCRDKVQRLTIRYSPAAMRLLSPTCRRVRSAAFCQASPYSPPPRTLTTPKTLPRSILASWRIELRSLLTLQRPFLASDDSQT